MRVDGILGSAPGVGLIGDETAVTASVNATSETVRLESFMTVESLKGGGNLLTEATTTTLVPRLMIPWRGP